MALTSKEVEFILREFIADEQRRLQTVLKPYIAELCHVAARKPPQPVHLPDGRVMIYKGPTADDLGGPYKAPRWLEELCRDDMRFVDTLRRVRRHTDPPREEHPDGPADPWSTGGAA